MKARAGKQPWPKSLAERVQAVQRSLEGLEAGVTAEELAQSFSRAKPADVAAVLETLATLGLIREVEAGRFAA